ncbi:MAG: hypothetical protein HC835_02840 [Oscillatoriales cyanobacterium RM2_1_1]|nr:hypothetical protein [Oscillatoriales cyanobacterium RM2_1_1]
MAFELQILHASDQEAGIPALTDAPGLSAVLNALEDDFENTIKLSSGDLFIAGPFSMPVGIFTIPMKIPPILGLRVNRGSLIS